MQRLHGRLWRENKASVGDLQTGDLLETFCLKVSSRQKVSSRCFHQQVSGGPSSRSCWSDAVQRVSSPLLQDYEVLWLLFLSGCVHQVLEQIWSREKVSVTLAGRTSPTTSEVLPQNVPPSYCRVCPSCSPPPPPLSLASHPCSLKRP